MLTTQRCYGGGIDVSTGLVHGERRAGADGDLVRVIVCDDEPAIRKLYRRALAAMEVDLIEAVDADDCLDKAASLDPHVVVVDVSLPGRSGLDILQELRQHAPGARIIVISGLVTASTVDIALELGAEACVGKVQFLPQLRALVQDVRS